MVHVRMLLTCVMTMIAAALLSPSIAYAAAGPEPPAYLRVVHAYTARADGPIAITIDGTGAGLAAWASASAWIPIEPGDHQVRIGEGVAATVGSIDVPPGCRVTVLATQPDVTTPAAYLTTVPECTHQRIPPGQARITTSLVADVDFGAVEIRVGDTVQRAVPLEPTPARLVPAGPTTVAVGTSGGNETFQTDTYNLLAGTAYTLLWAGGGEVPSRLVVILDATQATESPPPGQVIHTGDPNADGRPVLWWWPAAALATGVLAATWRARTGCAPRRSPAVMPLAAVLACCIVVTACAGPGEPAPPQDPQVAPVGPHTPPEIAPTPPTAPTPGDPTGIRIRAIAIDQPVIALPTDAVGALPDALPLGDVAWISGSSRPGEMGTSAVLGHTTSTGRGAFAALARLRTGDVVEIIDARGNVFQYLVRGVYTVAKDAFPTWVWAPQPVPALVLVSCTGASTSAGAASNRLVWTTLRDPAAV